MVVLDSVLKELLNSIVDYITLERAHYSQEIQRESNLDKSMVYAEDSIFHYHTNMLE